MPSEQRIQQKERRTWIGCDLDGTLAKDMPDWNGDPKVIGEPVPLMVERVQRWLGGGTVHDVRIMTARVFDDGSPGRDTFVAAARSAIYAWCQTHIGQVLDVTCCKDFRMVELWDDRAVQVLRNTGRRADEQNAQDYLDEAIAAIRASDAMENAARMGAQVAAATGIVLVRR